MFLTEWNEQEMRQRDRDEVRMDERHRVATDMLLEKEQPFTISAIAKISKLSEDVITGIANSLGVKLA